MFRLQEREKRRRRVLIEQMKAHEAQEVRKKRTQLTLETFAFQQFAIFRLRGPGCCSEFFAAKLFCWDVVSVYPVLIESFRFQDEDEYEI